MFQKLNDLMPSAKALAALGLLLFLATCLFGPVKGECKEAGWFGDDCKYKCRCQGGNSKCNSTTGDCDGLCEYGWMAEKCQFVQLTDWRAETIKGRQDGTVTCSDNSLNHIELATNGKSWLRSMRIWSNADVASDSYDVQVLINGNFWPCSNKEIISVGVNVMDFHCSEINEHVETIRFRNGTINSWCMVKINGGRDLTLRQEVSLNRGETVWDGSKAVDDKYPGDDVSSASEIAESCIQTDSNGASWTIKFPHPIDIYRLYLIHDVLPSDEDRLRFVFTQGSVQTPVPYKMVISKNAEYLLTMKVARQVSQLQIENAGYEDAVKQLRFCEVKIFGGCPEGRAGSDCQHDCLCAEDHYCPELEGCDTGCSDGYVGAYCSQPCPHGVYGQDCHERCSSYCNGTDPPCDFITGKCPDGCLGDFIDDACKVTAAQSGEPLDEGGTSSFLTFLSIAFLIGAALGLAAMTLQKTQPDKSGEGGEGKDKKVKITMEEPKSTEVSGDPKSSVVEYEPTDTTGL